MCSCRVLRLLLVSLDVRVVVSAGNCVFGVLLVFRWVVLVYLLHARVTVL